MAVSTIIHLASVVSYLPQYQQLTDEFPKTNERGIRWVRTVKINDKKNCTSQTCRLLRADIPE